MRSGFGWVAASVLWLVAGLSTAASFAQDVGDASPATTLDAVLVTGEQPGPGLWRVVKSTPDGDHVLWILGSLRPLPKKLKWHSEEVEAAIAQSQELLLASSVRADIGFFRSLTLLPSLIGVRNNPDGAKLRDVVPPDLYARWLVLKHKYLGDDRSVEKWRPIFAARELYVKAIEAIGLETSEQVVPVVEKLAKKSDLAVVTPRITLEIDKPRAAIKEFKKTPISDVKCLARTIERLETDLDLMRARAIAWSVGDVKALRAMKHVDQIGACLSAVMDTQIVQERGYGDMPERMADLWVTAAEAALARNKSTFAVLSIDEIFKSDGYLAKLRAQGYSVREP